MVGLTSEVKAEGKAEHVGPEICKGCHEARYKNYTSSVHGKKGISGSPANGAACEACHGAGGRHVSKKGEKGTIFAFSKTSAPQEISGRCLSCHKDSQPLSGWEMGRHKTGDVSCTDCHAVHTEVTNKVKVNEWELCSGCHRDIRAELNKQSRHPVKEGLMKCSDCHDPHGAFGNKLIKADSTNELCYRCHAEKRGPFMWSHSPVEENCLSCHEAHGSSHGRLLVMKVPTLCQNCHDAGGHPSQPYTAQNGFNSPSQSNKFFGRSCLNCHTNIHGSNGPLYRGNMFAR
ncbi:MAG: DmsE family decaheme c-type cytochrome [Nitrospirales bacterium]|nr:DmsE family decaheme c-type cytochrome [Nitrospirales bacterium]